MLDAPSGVRTKFPPGKPATWETQKPARRNPGMWCAWLGASAKRRNSNWTRYSNALVVKGLGKLECVLWHWRLKQRHQIPLQNPSKP